MINHPFGSVAFGSEPVAEVVTTAIQVEMPSPIGAPAFLSTSTGAYTYPVVAEMVSPLGALSFTSATDFASFITDPTEYYVARITGDPVIEVPISSWQATLSLDSQAFLQIVIPAASEYVGEISARQATEKMQVYRQTVIDGQVVETQFANTDISTIEIAQGPLNYTATLRGYFTRWTTPGPSQVYELQGIRTMFQSSTGAMRARCNIDWNVRPNYTVSIDGSTTFTVGYINFFVPSDGDAYMDVGTRG